MVILFDLTQIINNFAFKKQVLPFFYGKMLLCQETRKEKGRKEVREGKRNERRERKSKQKYIMLSRLAFLILHTTLPLTHPMLQLNWSTCGCLKFKEPKKKLTWIFILHAITC